MGTLAPVVRVPFLDLSASHEPLKEALLDGERVPTP